MNVKMKGLYILGIWYKIGEQEYAYDKINKKNFVDRLFIIYIYY